MRYCSISSGSKGNSSVFTARNTHILIDAGISTRRMTQGLGLLEINPAELSGILVTHEHSDHIKGLKSFAEKFRVPIYVNDGAARALDAQDIDLRLIRSFRTGEDFFIKDICVNAIALPHDAAEPVGYTLSCAGRRIAFMTDLGYVTKDALIAAKGAELVVLEANHDLDMLKNGRYPEYLKKRVMGKRGHLSNADCAQAVVELVQSGVANIVLAHLSQENNRPELARATVTDILLANNIIEGKDVHVGLALQDIISPIYELG